MRNDVEFILGENLVKHQDVVKIIKEYDKNIVTNFKVNNELLIKHLENIESDNEYTKKINDNILDVIKNTNTENIEEQLQYLKLIQEQLKTLNENNLISQEEFKLLNENLEEIDKKFTKYNDYLKKNVGTYENVKYTELLKRLKTEDKKTVVTDIFKKTFDLKKDERVTGKSGLFKVSSKALGGLLHVAGLALDSPGLNLIASELLTKRKEKIEKEYEKEKEIENKKRDLELSLLNVVKPIKTNTSFVEQKRELEEENQLKNENIDIQKENFNQNTEIETNRENNFSTNNLNTTNKLLEQILKIQLDHLNFIKEVEQDKELDNKNVEKTFTKPIKKENIQQIPPELLKSLQEMSQQQGGSLLDFLPFGGSKKPGVPTPTKTGGGIWNKIKSGAGVLWNKGKGVLTSPKKLIGAAIIGAAAAYGTKKLADSIGTGKEEFKITSDFGERIHPVTGERKFHNGVDINTPIGTPIKAPTSGVVTSVKNDKKGGLSIVFQGDDGYTYGYAHLNKIDVKPGQKLKEGDKLGETGNTGVGTGAHLHLTKKETATGEYVHPFTNQKASEYALASNIPSQNIQSKNNPLQTQNTTFDNNISTDTSVNQSSFGLKEAAVIGGIGLAGTTALSTASKIGKPNTTSGKDIQTNIQKVENVADTGKVVSKTSKLGKAVKTTGKVIGKLALPLTIASTAMDVYEGVSNTAEIVGKDQKDVNTADKIKAGAAGLISGLTFGLVSPKEVYDFGSKMMDKIDESKGGNNIVQDYSLSTDDLKSKKINTNIEQKTKSASELSENKNATDIKKDIQKTYNNSQVIQYIDKPNKSNTQQTNTQPIVINNNKSSEDKKQPIIIKTNDDSFINMLYKSYYLGV